MNRNLFEKENFVTFEHIFLIRHFGRKRKSIFPAQLLDNYNTIIVIFQVLELKREKMTDVPSWGNEVWDSTPEAWSTETPAAG